MGPGVVYKICRCYFCRPYWAVLQSEGSTYQNVWRQLAVAWLAYPQMETSRVLPKTLRQPIGLPVTQVGCPGPPRLGTPWIDTSASDTMRSPRHAVAERASSWPPTPQPHNAG